YASLRQPTIEGRATALADHPSKDVHVQAAAEPHLRARSIYQRRTHAKRMFRGSVATDVVVKPEDWRAAGRTLRVDLHFPVGWLKARPFTRGFGQAAEAALYGRRWVDFRFPTTSGCRIAFIPSPPTTKT